MKSKVLLIMLFFLISNVFFAQSKTFTGILLDSLTKEPVPFARVSLLSEEKIITGATTDFDGKYIIRIDNDNLNSFNLLFRMNLCYYPKSVEGIKMVNDTLIQTYYIQEIPCDSIEQSHCVYHDEQCDVYLVKDYWDQPKTRRRNKKRKSDKLQEKVVYLKAELYPGTCCLKKWYCKAHDHRF